MGKIEPSYSFGGNGNYHHKYGDQDGGSSRSEKETYLVIAVPAMLHLGMCLKDCKSIKKERNTCTPMFMAALCVIAKL
jgi:hypothetical protein